MIVDMSALIAILRDDFSPDGVPPKDRRPEWLAEAAPLARRRSLPGMRYIVEVDSRSEGNPWLYCAPISRRG
jgi:hypothetical protein